MAECSKPTNCLGCGLPFPSKNAVYRHLMESDGACLTPEEYQEFLKYVVYKLKRQKVVILYGYILPAKPNDGATIQNGEDVAHFLLNVIEKQFDSDLSVDHSRTNRSYGNASHGGTHILKQEDNTSAVTEVLAAKLPPLMGDQKQATNKWLNEINQQIQQELEKSENNKGVEINVMGRQIMPLTKFNAEMDVSHRHVEYLLPAEFLYTQPELYKTHVEFFQALPSFSDGMNSRKENQERGIESEEDMQRPGPEAWRYLGKLKKMMQSLTTNVIELDLENPAEVMEKTFHEGKRQKNKKHNSDKRKERKAEENIESLSASKESDHKKDITMEIESEEENKSEDELQVDPELLKEDQVEEEKNGKNNKTPRKGSSRQQKKKTKQQHDKSKKKVAHVLKRKRFHNFTPTVMAHEYLAYRRLDRFYHRATIRYVADESNMLTQQHPAKCATDKDRSNRPFLALSMSGDLFLAGQPCRVVGLFIAMARGVIDADIVDCVFDEDYPHLIPTPPMPTTGMYARDVYYTSVEGKVKAILTPRKGDYFPNGWNTDDVIDRVRHWEQRVRLNAAKTWLETGVESDGRLKMEAEWTQNVLNPWAVRARKELEDYRAWKKNQDISNEQLASASADEKIGRNGDLAVADLVPSLDSVDPAVPYLYEKVLYYLREADKSGQWPSTTLKRQLVMVSNLVQTDGDSKDTSKKIPTSLSAAYLKAQSNVDDRASAYDFAEGQGGASGSFSVGAMPGEQCEQPKGNTLFPELMKAAFELEIALCPDREPSSTIAINRNAQFRPHTDSGAGAGQSQSLIVGLGTYSGGELVVEGEHKDIRYKPIEFNGWKQRHWTMPFKGERYSLVWFTPKGCEGVRGIDLCQ